MRASADFRADLTVGDNFLPHFLQSGMEEMSSNDGFKTIHAGGVDGDFVIPLNKRFKHCVWNQDLPR